MKYKCFLDMDGVISDFNGACAQAHGRPDPYLQPEFAGKYDTELLWGISEEEFYAPTNNIEFWVNLPKMPEADTIVAMIEDKFGRDNVAILTAPTSYVGCAGAKRLWIQKHYPQFEKRLILAAAGAKQFLAAPDKVLIDDRDSNVQEFRLAGGIAITVPRPWNKLHGYRPLSWLEMGLENL